MKKYICLLLLSTLACIGGCGPVLGLVADAFPKSNVPAQYETTGKKVAVYVSSSGNTEPGPVFKRELTNRMNSTLLANNAASSTVDYSDISNLKLNTLGIVTAETIGEKLDVDLVIKIEVERFSIDFKDTDKMSPGQVLCFLSVLDATNGRRLWPTEQLHKTISVSSSLDHDSQVRLTNSLIQRNLAEQAAITISELFYKHKAK